MATERVYVAQFGDNERLIRASHPSVVMQFVAREIVKVKVASQEDLIRLLNDEIKVETIKAEQQTLDA